jgi:tripartite-type tricarboxylate transporter receptor subunit TctC
LQSCNIDGRRAVGRAAKIGENAMRLLRRQFLQMVAGAAALPVTARVARAQVYPTRPVRLVVSYPAGNASDSIGRLAAQALADRLGQAFVVENRPGAGGTLGTGLVAKAAPDGYTLLMEVVTANVMSSTLYPDLNYDFARDIAPVARLGEGPYVMIVNPAVPAATLPAFIAYAKANAGKINMASTGNGSPTHVFGELFRMSAGIDLLHVPYRGSFMPDLLSGQVQLVFGPIGQSIEFIRSGKLRALAVTTAGRQPALPDVPAVREFVPGYEASAWYGIGAPQGTPDEIIGILNREMGAALADAAIKSRLAALGVTPMPMTPAAFGSFISAETEKWAKVIHATNIKLG